MIKSTLSFEQFNQAITEIVRYIKLDNAVSDLFNRYSKETNFNMEFPYPLALITTAVTVLEIAAGDEANGWISYWLFELNCGEDYHDGTVTENGKIVPLKTTKDLWNMLCSEQEALN